MAHAPSDTPQETLSPQLNDLFLSALPDTVKRNILGRVLEGAIPGTEAPPPPPVVNLAGQAAAQAPLHHQHQQDTAQRIAGRRIAFPQLDAGAAIVDGVLDHQEVQAVSAAAAAWLSQHGRRPGMGGGTSSSSSSSGVWHDPSSRGDIHCWINPQELKAAGQQLLTACLQMLAALRSQLTEQGYDVSGRCSCQLACYPGNGARYVRHTDASASAPDRSVTALLYLNPEWDPQVDGGQLALYNAAHKQLSSSSGSQQPPPAPATASDSKPAAADGSGGQTQQQSATNSTDDAAAAAAAAGYLGGEPALLVAPLGGRLLVFDSRLPHEVLPAHKQRFSITTWFYRGGGASTSDAGVDAAAAAAAVTAPPAAADVSPRPPPEAAAATAAAPSSCPAPPPQQLPRIFVSIAAFRDAECQWTMRDLFVKAAHPQRVTVGVVWQVDPLGDAGFVRLAGGSRTAQYLPQVREVRCHYSTATGPCTARSMAQQLWAGEEFVLQVDAHMRFVQDWDELCLSELHAAQSVAGHPSVVLSTYPLGYDGQGAAAAVPDDGGGGAGGGCALLPATLLCAKEFDGSGLLRVQSRSLQQRPATPVPSFFWAAGFSFAPSSWLLQVPYCPHLPHLFFGEEQAMLLRMWTRGWDVYAPTQPLAFHQWERSARGNSYQACVQIDMAAREASQARVLALTQPSCGSCDLLSHTAAASKPPTNTLSLWHRAHLPSEADWGVGGVWGLGTARSVAQFEQLAGVSFQHKTIEPRALYGGQPVEAFEE